jgi:hypothetical protein
MDTFNEKDLLQFKNKGVHAEVIIAQIENFRSGFPFADLVRPATPGDGIEVLTDSEVDALVEHYDAHSGSCKIIKFVPASGAASRMFKALFEYLGEASGDHEEDLLADDKGFNSPWNFIRNIDNFAFHHDLKEALARTGMDLDEEIGMGHYSRVIRALVGEEGLDYGNLPKGLIKFHHYPEGDRVALEEHLVEAAMYATSGDGVAYVHFTVSPEHLERFREKVDEVSKAYEIQFGITFNISFSVQKPSTDTIAVDMENNPFREPDGTILFRPGGHGALIENLADMDGDILFIKNIDNVVPDRLKTDTTRFKKVIGGLLLKLQDATFKYLETLQSGSVTNEKIEAITDFAEHELKIALPEGFRKRESHERAAWLQRQLDRPMRICGMVKNEGEPGGGPFWIRNSQGQVSLQVVESSQINHNDPEQVKHLHGATHFNPVDLVCGTKDHRGNKFDLHRFIDPRTGFISVKSKGGKDLKAQELPGLWNGAMADWITLFVEVPILTFNPVKTVNDLLREQHQPA